MRALRMWTVRHSRAVEVAYVAFLNLATALAPLFKKIPLGFLETAVKIVEKPVKELIFDCHMCGQCVLGSTGMACPMNCPKYLRNGPCGGILADGMCEVEPDMRCVWLEAWDGGRRMRNTAIWSVRPPLSNKVSTRSSWVPILRGGKSEIDWPAAAEPRREPKRNGPPTGNGFQARLEAGTFTVTTEFNPPDTADGAEIGRSGAALGELCDALNITDGAGARTHISSLAVCAILAGHDIEAVQQMTCRDRNRIAIQADLLGAAALGVKNILCMTGDGVQGGDQRDAKPVFDLDATSLISLARHLRDDGRFLSGRKLDVAPTYFVGGTANPMSPYVEVEIGRLTKKIEAGAQFLQSQFCFDMEGMETFMAAFRAAGLDRGCYFLAGVGPLTSAKSARWMRANIPGVRIPDAVIDRLEAASDPRAEGRRISVEIIERIREIKGVSGVHIMAIGQPDAVAEIVEKAAIGPRYASP